MAIALHAKSRTTKFKRLAVVGLSLSLVLLIALGGLTYYTVTTLNNQQAATTEQMSQLEQALASAESQQKEQQSQLQSQEDQLKEMQKELDDATSEIKEQEKEIKDKNKTIKSLKTRISLKEAGKSTYTTLDQDLPEREYEDQKGKKLVALTFDDGPGPYTERLLDAMKKRGVKATFFVLGNRVDSYGDLIKRMEKEGHVVGNHSYDHPNLTKLSYSQIKTNMEKTAKKVQKLIGHKPEVMRCPGGSVNNTVKKYAKNAGIPIIYWGVDTRDWESRNVNKILKVAFGSDGIKNGSIVLMHDIYETTVTAAIKMMDRLIEEGYTFVTVPEMLMARKGKITPGTMYI